MAKTTKDDAVNILEISAGEINFAILGSTPLIYNRMAEKAKRTLLLGGTKKTTADKAANLKHDPIQEFRDSVYRAEGGNTPTRLVFPAPAFKGAMATAALDLPGTKRAEIGRLVWVDGHSVNVWGTPKLLMSVVRSADINRTPDIRTRAIVQEWACFVRIKFVRPKLNETSLANLMAAAGITAGVGDFRQEKGKGNYGQFRLVSPDDADFVRIVETGGRQAQEEALEKCETHDAESAEMLEWYSAEIIRLGKGKRNAA